ncbi:SymE family type I addiction module toxin [Cytophagaceae bacterium DM2B3-1]|uniref:SymE family type I addiction module toxin n=1 Tax=Xanthocytophaga flava TaxID=3048013 RepID=A0ABT7CYE9_9BACT|nr:SymE family type I addiction module toxin [Xanthocytophaga flavus]MDJ1498799.1 SymE family type I addiction module toxin [Xanthocytophaga flavus]
MHKPRNPKKDRKLKVSASYRRRKYGRSAFVPQLTLSGAWLAAAGFAPGDPVVVQVEDDQIRITRMPGS